MRFSEQWLREWVNPPLSTEQLAHQLTMAGLEVDAVQPVAGAFSGVLVGEVLSVTPHPDADKLRICQVNAGGEPLTIVCGAANVRQGMRAPTAIVGAELPGGLKIRQAKLRGIASEGMLCSAKELGLSESALGLMELPTDAPVGQDVRDYLKLDDVAIELGLTPNRGDCLSVAGIAREVAALNRIDAVGPKIAEVPPAIDDTFPVAIEAPEGCPRYVGRVVRGIDNRAKTPLWIQERLRRSGLRSLGPVVDVTNYVLLELGQPMHGFDLAKLSGGIHARQARPGERLVLLDEQEIGLDEDCLVIADGRGPLAFAGVMGGAESGVTEGTTDVFLESAFFPPDAIIGRARRYGLHTDSSHRFERGVSPDLQRRAMERATALLLAIAGGRAGPIIEALSPAHRVEREPVCLRHARVERLLGMAIPTAEVEEILHLLGMQVAAEADGWRVIPPPYRFDLGIEEDLIEEVGRVHGYDRVPSIPPVGSAAMLPQPEGRLPLYALLDALADRGYQEAITYSFVAPRMARLLDPQVEALALANPISADMSVMRTNLWPGLIGALIHNLNRQQGRVRLFEWGLVFVPEPDGVQQREMLGGVVCGSADPEQWGLSARPVDFYDVKGDVESLLAVGGREFTFQAAQHPALHPGQTAAIAYQGEPVGWLGALHPSVQQELGLPRTFVFQIALPALKVRKVPSFRELSKFPAIRRDIAVVVDRSTDAQSVRRCILAAAPGTLQELKLFDVYEGEGIDSGRKSLAFGLTLQDNSRTLTDDEVDAAVGQIIAALRAQLGAELRE